MKNILQGKVERSEVRENITEFSFEPSPLFFNRIEVGRVSREKNNLTLFGCASSIKRVFLWKEALSQMINLPRLISFSKQCSNQNSIKSLSVEQLYCLGATRRPKHRPAMRFVRSNFFPLICPVTLTPSGARAYHGKDTPYSGFANIYQIFLRNPLDSARKLSPSFFTSLPVLYRFFYV